MQIALDIVARSNRLESFDHPGRVIGPVRRLVHRQVVDSADFVEIDELVGGADDLDRGVAVERRFERDPGKDAAVMKGLRRFDPVRLQLLQLT